MHINNRSLTKPIVHKSVVLFNDFSFCNFLALLINLHVNMVQAELVSFAVPGKERSMIQGPSSAIDMDLN